MHWLRVRRIRKKKSEKQGNKIKNRQKEGKNPAEKQRYPQNVCFQMQTKKNKIAQRIVYSFIRICGWFLWLIFAISSRVKHLFSFWIRITFYLWVCIAWHFALCAPTRNKKKTATKTCAYSFTRSYFNANTDLFPTQSDSTNAPKRNNIASHTAPHAYSTYFHSLRREFMVGGLKEREKKN